MTTGRPGTPSSSAAATTASSRASTWPGPGCSTLILERRPFVGGACNTEEFAPGYRASTGAYVLSMLRPAIWTDMKLVERGIVVDEAGPSLNLYPDGASYLLGDDMDANIEETKRFSAHDARALPAFEDELGEVVKAVLPIFDMTAPDPRVRGLRRPPHHGHDGPAGGARTASTSTSWSSCSPPAPRRCSTSGSTASTCAPPSAGTRSTTASPGPSTPGTAFVLLHDHASDTGDAGVRQWGFVRGGMGVLTERMADAAREAGADGPLRRRGRVGPDQGRPRRRRAAASAARRSSPTRVLSNADPKRTFLRPLRRREPPRGLRPRRRGLQLHGHEHQDQPRPVRAARTPRGSRTTASSRTTPGIVEMNPFIAEMDLQQAQAAYGIAVEGSHVEMCFPTVHDPSLAPEGKHVATIDVNSQPFHLREGTWDDIKDTRADQVVAQLEQLLPRAVRPRRAPAGAEPARHGAGDGAHRRARPARRHGAAPAAVHAAGPRLGEVPHAAAAASTCVARARTPAAGSPAPTAATPRARCCATRRGAAGLSSAGPATAVATASTIRATVASSMAALACSRIRAVPSGTTGWPKPVTSSWKLALEALADRDRPVRLPHQHGDDAALGRQR